MVRVLSSPARSHVTVQTVVTVPAGGNYCVLLRVASRLVRIFRVDREIAAGK